MAGEKRKKSEKHAEAVLDALSHYVRRRIMRIALAKGHVSISPTSERPTRGSIQHFYRANKAVTRMPMVTAVLEATSDSD